MVDLIRARKLLLGARVGGACAVGLIAQAAVDMPAGHFGGRDQVTPAGAYFAAGLLLAGLVVVLGLRRERRWAFNSVPLVLIANVAMFVPAVAADPVVAGLVLVWNLALLLQHFFPAPRTVGGLPPVALDEGDRRRAAARPALRHLSLAAIALTAAVVGYRLSASPLALSACLALHLGALALGWPFLRRLAVRRSRGLLLLAVPLALALAAAGEPPLALSLLGLVQAGLLFLAIGQHRTTLEILGRFYERPSRLIAVSFAAAPGSRISPIDALFTSTSAVCVTGLIVLDTPSDFSLFGQIVILVLIQVGGLGIMVLSTFGALILGSSLGLKGEWALSQMLELPSPVAAYRLTRFIVLSTLVVEALGAAVLTACFRAAGLPWPTALWRGAFHSISAFCNAGFALQSDSLELFRGQPVALLAVAALIVAGGIGFVVLAALWTRLSGRQKGPLAVQVKVVLLASAALVALGAVAFAALEWRSSLDGLATTDRLVNALFQSVTTRTAGFSSVDLGATRPATQLLLMLLMLIGASPGSTGGGIKTTTVVVLLAGLRSASRIGGPVRLFGREISPEIVYRSLAIAVLFGFATGASLFVLLLVEGREPVVLAFEAVSALGTVGLSLGATGTLGGIGKLVIIASMFIGRIGPLTLALLLGGAAGARRPAGRFPEERIMVG